MRTYQILISLKKISPRIWRRLIVPADIPLQDLHKIIQTSMGWWNCHLHQFIKDRKFYLERNNEDDFNEESNTIDYSDLTLSDMLVQEEDFMEYEYDFGDGWLHEIVLEKIIDMNPGLEYPECLAGKRNCPPEDCGGPYGYSNLLKILSNPKAKKFKEMKEWIGGDFDPESFDKDAINDLLKDEDYGTPSYE